MEVTYSRSIGSYGCVKCATASRPGRWGGLYQGQRSPLRGSLAPGYYPPPLRGSSCLPGGARPSHPPAAASRLVERRSRRGTASPARRRFAARWAWLTACDCVIFLSPLPRLGGRRRRRGTSSHIAASRLVVRRVRRATPSPLPFPKTVTAGEIQVLTSACPMPHQEHIQKFDENCRKLVFRQQ